MRTRIVCGSFLVAMAVVSGLLALGESRSGPGFLAAGVSVVGDRPDGLRDPIFQVRSLERARWRAIIIHDSGEPGGDPESLRRRHLDYGYRMMGYHFLVGNGNGMGDGVVHVGERWVRQTSGWHAVGPYKDYYNRNAVAICLVGNGDRRPFTRPQVAQLVSLVRRLQQELGIPASAVRLHRDIAGGLTTSPGRYFPAAELEQQLVNAVR